MSIDDGLTALMALGAIITPLGLAWVLLGRSRRHAPRPPAARRRGH